MNFKISRHQLYQNRTNNDLNILNISRNNLFSKDKKYLELTPWYVTGLTDGEGSYQRTIQDIKGKGFTGYKPFL